MAGQIIKQPSIFGRLGTGIGKGLGEQIPKEIERNRLASGLKNLGEQKDLSPFQQFAGLVGTAHEYPQVVQSGSELLKQQALRNAYSNRGKGQQSPQGQSPNDLSQVDFANIGNKKTSATGLQQNEQIPQGNYPSGEPQIVEKNPLSPELQPNIRWTPEQRDSEIQRVWDQNPGLTFPEVSSIVANNEQRYMEAPEDYRKQQESLKGVKAEVDAEIEAQLRKKLHIGKGEEIFSKLSGESVNRIERGVSRDLRKNPNANLNDVVNTWTDRALANEKQKSDLKSIAERPWDEKAFKKGENLEKLKSIGKSFKEFGNSEEYKDSLISDFKTSPEGAASIAYPLSKSAQSYISKMKKSHVSNFNVPYSNETSIKAANDLSEYLTHEDSILSIAKNMKEKDPYFDIKGFLSEVRNIEDELSLTPQQKKEINSRGISDIFPNWGDIFLFPNFGKGL